MTEEELQAKQEEHEKALEELQEKARVADEARVRAEAERDAFKNVSEIVRQPEKTQDWTDEQWATFCDKNGVTKEQVATHAGIAKAQIDMYAKEWDKKAKAAEDRAAKAEERAQKLESDISTKSVKSDFFDKKPALARYKTDVDEFVNLFPESERNNPEKLKVLLDKAETYVKGKVGAKMQLNPGGSQKLNQGHEDPSSDDGQEIDTKGLKPVEERLLRSILPSKERQEKLSKEAGSATLGEGISVVGQNEWDRARESVTKQFGKF